MSGETEANISGWTTDTIHSHILSLLSERDVRYAQHFDDIEKSVLVALIASEKALDKVAADIVSKFATVNEFRGALEDAQRTFITRIEAEAAIERNVERVRELTERISLLMSRTETTSLADRATERIKELSDKISALEYNFGQMKGKGTGYGAAWNILLGLVSVVAVACSLWLAFHK